MNFEVKFSNKSAKFLRGLPKDILERIKNKFKDVALEPFRYLEHLEGEGYKMRIGNFRAIIDVDKNRNLLLVRVFDKRSKIYK